MKRRLPLLAVISVQLLTVAFPQQAPTGGPGQKPSSGDEDVVRITTNLVQVDAVITDSQGKPVTDLKPEEVEIFEDGRKQKITNFSFTVLDTPPSTAAPRPSARINNTAAIPVSPPKREDVRRTIAIVVDDLGLSFESTHFVRRALKKFVDEQMQTGDLVAIVRSSGGMGALQQFTTDKRQLYAAIERVKWNPLGRGDVSAFALVEPPTPGPKGPEIDAFKAEANRFREDLFAVGTLGAINYVVKGLKDLPGRKSVLLVSDGFRIYKADDPNRDYRALERLRRLVDEAGRSSVVIYTMNATGLQTLSFTAADNLSGRDRQQLEQAFTDRRNVAFETQEGLDYLARETGGLAIRNTNDLSSGIRRILEDQKAFYLIGYRPDQTTFDRRTGRRTFHKLTLKVTRPGRFNVRMRNGFYGVTDEERRVERSLAQTMYEALASPFASAGVHLQLTSLFANDPQAGSYIRSVLHVNARDLTFTDEPNNTHKNVFDILAVTFGENGLIVDQVGRTYTMQLPDDVYKRALREGLVYYVTVPVKKAGAYQLRMSLRDSVSERVGSASQFIEIPDLKKNRLAVSSIVMRGTSATGDATGAQQEGFERGNAEASPAVRHFRHGMFLSYACYVYNARLEKLTNLPQLTYRVRMFREGQLVFDGRDYPINGSGAADLKRLTAAGAIQLGTDLPPGEYVMQLTVTDALADEKYRTVTQWMDFEIVK